jgi:hypothetical protein
MSAGVLAWRQCGVRESCDATDLQFIGRTREAGRCTKSGDSIMRRFVRVLKISIFIGSVIAAYGIVVCLALQYARIVGSSIAGSLVAAGVAIVTGIVALIGDKLWNAINQPRLRIRFFPYDKRDCHATEFRDRTTGAMKAKAHYFRIRVENTGWRSARDVEVTLESVKRFDNRHFVVDTDFMPLRLLWSHWREKRYEISIPAGAYRHCDFAFVVDPAAKSHKPPATKDNTLPLWFDVFLRPNTGRTSLLPGQYQVTLSAFGRNAKGTMLTIELEWKGKWYDDIDDLLKSSLLPKKGFKPA